MFRKEGKKKRKKKNQQASLLDGLLKTACTVSLCYKLLFLSYIRLWTFFVLCFFQQEKEDKQYAHEFCSKVHQLQQICIGLPLQSIQ